MGRKFNLLFYSIIWILLRDFRLNIERIEEFDVVKVEKFDFVKIEEFREISWISNFFYPQHHSHRHANYVANLL